MLNLKTLCAALALFGILGSEAIASNFPSQVLQNQFGEKSVNALIGGSNQIDVNFIVDSTNGLGVRSVNGPGVKHVYMNSSSPSGGNPNPAAGLIWVQLANNFASYISSFSGFVSPVSGTPIPIASASPQPLASGSPYVITTVGSTTQAQWAAIGLPAGVSPAVGASFIASALFGLGSGAVESPAASGSGAFIVDMVGDASKEVGATGGAWVLARVLAATSSSVTTLVATAPADGSVIDLRFSFNANASQLH